MPSAAFNKFYPTVASFVNDGVDFATDQFKVLFSNTLPVDTNAVSTDITQIASGGGYTNGATGGVPVATVSSTETAGTYALILAATTFTATGGSVGPFEYVILYDATAAARPLLGWWDYGSAITLNNGDSLVMAFDQVNGVLQLM